MAPNTRKQTPAITAAARAAAARAASQGNISATPRGIPPNTPSVSTGPTLPSTPLTQMMRPSPCGSSATPAPLPGSVSKEPGPNLVSKDVVPELSPFSPNMDGYDTLEMLWDACKLGDRSTAKKVLVHVSFDLIWSFWLIFFL